MVPTALATHRAFTDGLVGARHAAPASPKVNPVASPGSFGATLSTPWRGFGILTERASLDPLRVAERVATKSPGEATGLTYMRAGGT